jgi:hypothetical protein
MAGFLRIFCVTFLPVFAYLGLRIWKPTLPGQPAKPIADRIGWTVFSLGLCLMLNMVLVSALAESDGAYRSWDTIRLHVRVFLSFAMISIVGPLVIVIRQVFQRYWSSKQSSRKSVLDK